MTPQSVVEIAVKIISAVFGSVDIHSQSLFRLVSSAHLAVFGRNRSESGTIFIVEVFEPEFVEIVEIDFVVSVRLIIYLIIQKPVNREKRSVFGGSRHVYVSVSRIDGNSVVAEFGV